jgi:hypothetical protein
MTEIEKLRERIERATAADVCIGIVDPIGAALRIFAPELAQLKLAKDQIVSKDSRITQLVSALDSHNGTPCEQVRHQQEADTLRVVLRQCLNYIENTESELGIKLSCGDAARAALQTGKESK